MYIHLKGQIFDTHLVENKILTSEIVNGPDPCYDGSKSILSSNTNNIQIRSFIIINHGAHLFQTCLQLHGPK